MIRRMKLLVKIVMIIIPVSFSVAQDTLKLSNGNELYGEIKSLNKSIVVIETDYSDSDFNIEWEKIVQISSSRKFTIFLSSREKIYASIQPSAKTGHVVLIPEGGGSREIKLEEMVIIDPIEDSFANRFNASISAGFTITKANNAKQFSSRATASYSARNWNLSGNINDTRSTQDDVESIQRTDGSVNFNYLFYENWFAAFNYDFLSNTEQQIQLRSTQTLALGNLLVRNNRLYLSASGGITFNREDYSNEENIFNTTEGFLGCEFNAYDVGDLNFLVKLGYYPSFTEADRHRVNFSADVKYEFPLEFFIKAGYTLNFDSRPPNEGAREDYVFQTTLGWEF